MCQLLIPCAPERTRLWYNVDTGVHCANFWFHVRRSAQKIRYNEHIHIQGMERPNVHKGQSQVGEEADASLSIDGRERQRMFMYPGLCPQLAAKCCSEVLWQRLEAT